MLSASDSFRNTVLLSKHFYSDRHLAHYCQRVSFHYFAKIIELLKKSYPGWRQEVGWGRPLSFWAFQPASML